ncbi:MAG TPA: hypothetical protein VFN81_08690 [Sphingomicrobium sp.]|nr:hypothetical protein [Sphingomicrobium sp.]
MTDQPMNEARAREIVGGFFPLTFAQLLEAKAYLAGLEAGRKENESSKAEILRLKSLVYPDCEKAHAAVEAERDKWRAMAERLAEALKKADKRVWEHHEIGYLSRAFRALADCELCTDRRFYETEEALAAFEKMKGETGK